MKKRGLGKGLEALLGSDTTINNVESNSTADINKITTNPFQPRKTFTESALKELADSIREHGIIQPIAVRNKDNGYEIIAGERRFRAAQTVGLSEVPIIIHEISDKDSAIFALIENIQREDLNVIEKALGLKQLINDFSLTHEKCAKVMGQSRSNISNTLRLLELDNSVQTALINKQIDMGHARALLGVDKATQQELLEKVCLNGLTVRETEALVRFNDYDSPKEKKTGKSKQIKIIEKTLRNHFNSKVSIREKLDGSGKITIDFNDKSEIDKILEKMDVKL